MRKKDPLEPLQNLLMVASFSNIHDQLAVGLADVEQVVGDEIIETKDAVIELGHVVTRVADASRAATGSKPAIWWTNRPMSVACRVRLATDWPRSYFAHAFGLPLRAKCSIAQPIISTGADLAHA